jgi:transposase
VGQAEIDDGVKPGVTSGEVARVNELEQEVRELRRANEILRRASAISPRRSWCPRHDSNVRPSD